MTLSVWLKILKKSMRLNEDDKAWRSSILYLTENAVALYKSTFDALEGKSANFVVKRLDGMVGYRKLSGAKPEGLLVVSSHGEMLLPWRDLSPDTMIALHKKISISQLSEVEKNQRREQLISYTWLCGFETKARIGAEILSEVSPLFSKRWKACMEAVK